MLLFFAEHNDHHRRSQVSEANSDQLSSNGSSSGCGSGSGASGGHLPDTTVRGGLARKVSCNRDSQLVPENMMTSPETYKLACTLQELLNSEEKYIKVRYHFCLF